MIFKMINSREIPIQIACSLLNVGRRSYYNWTHDNYSKNDNHLKNMIQKIALSSPKYGYRRITAELHRKNKIVNHKKVLKIMRENNLLCRSKKKFRITTTDSNHEYPTYPNLARDITLTGLNQLWVADITYVRLLKEYVYVAAIIDVFSRKCIGWDLSRMIDTALVLKALDMALTTRQHLGFAELVHHSDQGVQYASHEYVDLLKELDIRISMSRKGNPYDNAFAESFMKTLKAEEVYLKEYSTFEEAYDNIKEFIECVYNKKRLHSSIGYVPPEEYEMEILKNKMS